MVLQLATPGLKLLASLLQQFGQVWTICLRHAHQPQNLQPNTGCEHRSKMKLRLCYYWSTIRAKPTLDTAARQAPTCCLQATSKACLS